MCPDRCGLPWSAPAYGTALLAVMALVGPPACNGDEVGAVLATRRIHASYGNSVCVVNATKDGYGDDCATGILIQRRD